MNKIAKKLLAAPLYEGHGEESYLPEDAAEEIARLESLVEELKADRIRINDEAETEIKALQSVLATARKEGRREGLEEAATVAQKLNGWGSDFGKGGHAEHIAKCIRALKEKQP